MKRITHAVFSDPCNDCNKTHPTTFCLEGDDDKKKYIALAYSEADCDAACEGLAAGDGSKLTNMRYTPEEALEFVIYKNLDGVAIVNTDKNGMDASRSKLHAMMSLMEMIQGENGGDNGNSVKV